MQTKHTTLREKIEESYNKMGIKIPANRYLEDKYEYLEEIYVYAYERITYYHYDNGNDLSLHITDDEIVTFKYAHNTLVFDGKSTAKYDDYIKKVIEDILRFISHC